MLDLSKAEVSDHLYRTLDRLLRDHPITYLKWDNNRDLTTAGSGGRPAYRTQTLAAYALIDRLKAAHPGVEIESCASGGGRADYEILRRTDRIWTSDSNDARMRQEIQKGFSLFFPPEIMGCHVGPEVCHTSGRVFSVHFRAATALFGHFGLETDILKLSPEDTEILRRYIAYHKERRGLLHHGLAYRREESDGRELYGVVAGDRKSALFCLFQKEHPRKQDSCRVRFPGLDADTTYRVASPEVADKRTKVREMRVTGEALMESGILVEWLPPDNVALIELEA